MKKNAFTLVEIMTVLVILGVMAGLGLPRIFSKLEESRFSEGLSAIQTLCAAQLRYNIDHGAYTGTCTDLDVDIKTANFNAPVCDATNTAGNPLAKITRTGGAYTIQVYYDAGTQLPVLSCTGCTANLTNILSAR
ncbi:MAG: prepilin-type N-terminal cleavage/methylation domain-containing protein [Candidatus Omnitrophica bacterium]|nr:prepilin-type N-terminal cleavage/methylation domain-containing protein [Candidatus Omnitrophota bacterium]